jgi:hypothetical protein
VTASCHSCGVRCGAGALFCTNCGRKLDENCHGEILDQAVHRGLDDPQGRVERYFFSKIAGVSHLNKDGTSRQLILEQVQQFENLLMRPEPDNPVDPEAVMLVRASGQQVGYLEARVAHETTSRVRSGEMWGVMVTEVTGGTREQPTRGANIAMCKLKK